MSTSPEPETSDDDALTFEEMAENLGDRRRALLRVLQQSDGSTLNTSRLRERAGVPTGSIGHHLELLERWGLIEESGREYAGRGSRARVWAFTDDGETFVEEYLNSEGGQTASVDDLARRVDELEQQNQHLKEELRALTAALEDEGIPVADTIEALIRSRRENDE
ncbi:transcriptional regulator [Haladaptatus halobius]|uniref:transcriptional regulator n=1 Tax=Haladaptatus halobius TaxID=2884875 RepID=UPI001D0AB5A7|nr:transcriptional regulator [Haladaptatus halobius]